jgi:Periplasmic binding protein
LSYCVRRRLPFSAFAFATYRFLNDQGVPMLGGGFDGSYYYEKGNENIVSAYGDGTPVAGLMYDNVTNVMKQLGANTVGGVGYGVSPSSSASAKAVVNYAAKASGLKSGYLNTPVDFGTTDVAPIVLGIKNAGSDAVYMPLDTSTNIAIVQGLQQNNVDTKATLWATGYDQAILDSPAAKALTSHDVFQTAYKPVELGGSAVKTFRQNLKKYTGFSGVPGFGEYTGYVSCDLAIVGLQNAGKNPTRQGWVDAIRTTNGGIYNNAGLACSPRNFSKANFGKVISTSLRLVRRDQEREVVGPQRPQADHRQARRRSGAHQAVPKQRRHRGDDDQRPTHLVDRKTSSHRTGTQPPDSALHPPAGRTAARPAR